MTAFGGVVAAVVAELTRPERLAAYEGPDGAVRMAELFGVGVLLVMGASRDGAVDLPAALDDLAARLLVELPAVDFAAVARAASAGVDSGHDGRWRGLVWRTGPVPTGEGCDRLLVECESADGRDWWLTRWTTPSGLGRREAFWRADAWVHGLRPGVRAGQRFAQPALRLRRWALVGAAG